MKRIAPKARSNVVPLSGTKPSQPRVPKSVRVGDAGMRKDSLENIITGLGTVEKDKSVSTTYQFRELSRQQLEAAYRSDWIARKVVTIPAQDATREWRSWQSDNADIELLENTERDLGLQKKTFTAMWKARLYGGAGLLLGVNQGKLEDELIPEKVNQGDLKFIHVVTRWDLSAGEIDWNVDSKWYGLPKYYTRSQPGDAKDFGQKIHPSRIIRFGGNEIPDLTVAMGWSDSVLNALNDAVIAAGMSAAAGAQLVQELKMDVVKVPDLTASMANKAYEKRLLDRFAVAALAKGMYNVLLLDGDEEWQRIEANLAGLPDTLKMYLLIASGAADIPATRFLSQSPQGLSATGESDTRNYYDKVKSDQQTEVTPAMDALDTVLVRSTLGDVKDGDVVYAWRPLWQMDEKQKSEVTKSKADTYKVDLDAAQIPPDVLRDARINQLIEDGTYPGLEQILDDYGPLDTLEMEEEPVTLFGPNGEPLEPDPDVLGIAEVANENNLQPSEKKAVGDMARRIRKSLLRGDAFNPNQPRDPKGAESGGQWSSGAVVWTSEKSTHRVVKAPEGYVMQVHQNLSSNPDRPKMKWVRAANVYPSKTRSQAVKAAKTWAGDPPRAKGKRGPAWDSAEVVTLGSGPNEITTDATPKTLYVRREVINKAELLKWAREAGLDQFGELQDDLHVTIMYSRTPVDWGLAGDTYDTGQGKLEIGEGGMRMLDKLGLGGSAVALLFTASSLAWRHESLKNHLGCSWDWPYYQPHITFVYGEGGDARTIDFNKLREIEAYQGKIILGPEIWAETTQGY